MAEITTSGSDADLSFEARWEKALGQPEVSIADGTKITIDASPQAILARLRELADLSHAKGELTAQAYASIHHSSDQLEQAFSALAPQKLLDIVGALKARLRGEAK